LVDLSLFSFRECLPPNVKLKHLYGNWKYGNKGSRDSSEWKCSISPFPYYLKVQCLIPGGAYSEAKNLRLSPGGRSEESRGIG
jgi:hypothetical protein